MSPVVIWQGRLEGVVPVFFDAGVLLNPDGGLSRPDNAVLIQQIGEISVSITSYEAKDGKLSITISFLGTEETDEYTYSIKKNVLSLSDGNNTIELNKK